VALSANGTKLAFVAVDAKGTARIWVRPLASLTAERLNGTEGATFPFWSPNGRSIAFFADGRLKRINLDGGPAVTLCDAPFGRGGSWNREGTLIFAPASHTGIYKVSDSGGTPTPVTSLDTSIHTTHRWPKFLPDGRHFIYLAASHFQGASHNGVYVSSIDGEEQKLVIATDADAVYASGYLFFMRNDELMAQPFDLTGRQLQGEPRTTVEKVLYDSSIWKSVFDVSERDIMAYELGSSVSGTQLRWFDRSGRQLSVVGETGFQFEPRFSRDGHKLAEVISRVGYEYGKCWVYDLVRGVRTQITLGPYATSSPIWSPDGTRVLFAGKRQHYGIYEVGSGGAGRDRLILDTGTDIWPLDLSPDSRFLLYGQGENVGRVKGQLWIHSLDRSGSPFRLLEGDSVEADGRFSPDGRWVAYSSNESGRAEVYVVPFRVSSSFSKRTGMKEKWKISVHGGEQPNWRRDGRELFYLAADNTLMVVPIMSRGAKFEAGAAHALFHANPTPSTHYQSCYDVSPDGSRFIINTAAAERTAPITLVENWFSDFKK